MPQHLLHSLDNLVTETYYQPAFPIAIAFLGRMKNTFAIFIIYWKVGIMLVLVMDLFQYEEDEFFESHNTFKFEINIFTRIW